jgi:hypothetical protein
MDNRWGLPRSDGSYAVWGLPYPVSPVRVDPEDQDAVYVAQAAEVDRAPKTEDR